MSQIVTVGRRKTSVARIFLDTSEGGKGSMTINGRELDVYFPVDTLRQKVHSPFEAISKSLGDFSVKVNVHGGGITGQAEAIRMGISRALSEMNEENHTPLKKAGFLTRDPRMVERKKYGRKKARKKFQFSKR